MWILANIEGCAVDDSSLILFFSDRKGVLREGNCAHNKLRSVVLRLVLKMTCYLVRAKANTYEQYSAYLFLFLIIPTRLPSLEHRRALA